jgi:hypothetical protein
MGAPTSEVGYTSATTGSGGHEVHKGHVVALENKNTWRFLVFFPDIRHVNTFRNQLDKMYKQLNNVDRRNVRNSVCGNWMYINPYSAAKYETQSFSTELLPSVRCADTNIKQGRGTRIFQAHSLKCCIHQSQCHFLAQTNLSLAHVMKNRNISLREVINSNSDIS